ncbi:MAG: elongation factor Ts [Spirochaetales bacterium]|nr:elongation factor Ts [Spirochaetales bacterium]
MDIKPADVKKLRDTTGAGMMDCKNALIKAEGDFKAAEKLLKEEGLAAAAKRSGRATNEGKIFTSIKAGKAAIIELTCETDFVAMNENFINTGEALVEKVVNNGITSVTPELEEDVKGTIAKIKENISLRRLQYIEFSENEVVVDYVHGSKIGVIVKLEADSKEIAENAKVKEFAFDLALHVAAFNPLYLSRDKVNADYLKEQEEIFTTQAAKLDKPEKILKGIIQGKLNKHLAEICLLNQGFVKDEKQSVEKVLAALGKELGGKIAISDYIFYKLGEEL